MKIELKKHSLKKLTGEDNSLSRYQTAFVAGGKRRSVHDSMIDQCTPSHPVSRGHKCGA